MELVSIRALMVHDVDLLHLDGDMLELEAQLAKEVVFSLRTQDNIIRDRHTDMGAV